LVRHLIEVKNVRFLFTSKVQELIMHHLVKGLNFKQFRKTDFIDVEQQRSKQLNYLKEFKQQTEGVQADHKTGYTRKKSFG